MPTTQVQDVRDSLLEAIGLQSINHADSGQQRLILRAINSGLESMSTNAPSDWWRSDEFSAIIRAPLSAAVAVENASTEVTSTEITDEPWTRGQAIIITGDAAPNRILADRDGDPDAFSLLLPYAGSTGTHGATIYNDAIPMPGDFLRFKSDLSLVGQCRLQLVDSRQSGFHGSLANSFTTGTPSTGRLIARPDASGAAAAFLRLDTLPTSQQRLYGEYWAKPRRVAALSDERNDLVPQGYLDSVFIPMCLSAMSTMTDAIVINPQALAGAAQQAGQILSSIGDAEGPIYASRLQPGWND